MPLGALADLFEQIVHLPLDRTHFGWRIHQSGGPDDLLDDNAAGFVQFVRARRCRHVDQLRHTRFPLLEVERAVVERGRQTEPVVDEDLLTGAIAEIHAANLRDRLVTLVDDDERVGRQVVEKGGRRLARLAPGEVARIILDAVAIPDLANHLEVEHRTLVQPLCLEQLSLGFELAAALDELGLDGFDSELQPVARGHEV